MTGNNSDKNNQQSASEKEQTASQDGQKKPVYEKPKLRKYGQIDHIAAYGADSAS